MVEGQRLVAGGKESVLFLWVASTSHRPLERATTILRLDLTLDTPVDNLALDEALLESAEKRAGSESSEISRGGECLRLWEARTHAVVVGRSSRVAQEVDQAACAARGIPILRRTSGGATVVTGPGCLMYAVVLNCRQRPELRDITRAHRFVLGRIAEGLRPRVPSIACQGTSDLTLSGEHARKVSGNSLRVKKNHLLYHGTLLYDFDVTLVDQLLHAPPRQPDYRAGRQHSAFLANLPLSREEIRAAMVEAFAAGDSMSDWPKQQTTELAAQRYAQQKWTFCL